MHIQTSEQEHLELGFGDYTCNWGVHICGLYETEAERDEIIFGFLRQGDIAGDLQFYVPAERTRQDFIKRYAKLCDGCKDHVHNEDRFRLSSAKDLYYPEGIFSPVAMDEGLDNFYENSQQSGRRNIRATAEMVWALEAVPGVEHLMTYESRLNYFINNKPWISICLYNLTKFNGAIIIQALRTHPYMISNCVVTENPFFQDPDNWLRENAPQFLK